MEYLQQDMNCLWTINFMFMDVIKEVVVLIKIVEKNEKLYFDKDVAENQHTVKVQTQKGIMWDSIKLTVQYLPNGEHKSYDHVLTSNSTNTKHISGE